MSLDTGTFLEHKEATMPVFVLMTKLAPAALHDARGRRAMGKEWLKKVRAACPEVKWLRRRKT